MSQPAPHRVSYAEYLAREAASQEKHEYLRGEILAMAGGTPEHAALAAAIARALGNQLEGKPCRVFSADLRIRVEASDLSTYPDVTVVCGSLARSEPDPDAITNPVLLVEVLSDSSEAYDRGEKFAHYRLLPSLRAYLLVSQRSPRLELFTRTGASAWTLFDAGPGEAIQIPALGVELGVDEVYKNPLV